MVQRIKDGKPLYGESQMSPYLQGVAARNSRYGQLKFSEYFSVTGFIWNWKREKDADLKIQLQICLSKKYEECAERDEDRGVMQWVV